MNYISCTCETFDIACNVGSVLDYLQPDSLIKMITSSCPHLHRAFFFFFTNVDFPMRFGLCATHKQISSTKNQIFRNISENCILLLQCVQATGVLALSFLFDDESFVSNFISYSNS